LSEAGKAALDRVIQSIPGVDSTQCHVQGHWLTSGVRRCADGFERGNAASGAQFIACLEALPKNSQAYYGAEFWLPCPPDHPAATTIRRYLEGLVEVKVQELFATAPCPM
jgi:hypothetical protein